MFCCSVIAAANATPLGILQTRLASLYFCNDERNEKLNNEVWPGGIALAQPKSETAQLQIYILVAAADASLKKDGW